MQVPSLLLCEDVRQEVRGTHTLVGQFNALRGYLMEKYTFKVFFTVTDHFGLCKLKIVVKSPEGVELKKFYTDEITCTTRTDCNAGYFTITDLFLKSYGQYIVHVYNTEGLELNRVSMTYLVPNFKTNQLRIKGKEVEVPRVNLHDNTELHDFAKLFLRKFTPLAEPYKSIEFHSQFMMSDGIGSVSCHIVNSMIKKGIKVTPVPIFADPSSVQYIKSIPYENKCHGEADIAIVNTLPPHIKNACNAKRILLLSYWEASKIDQSWVNVSNTADGILVPSNYVKNVYVRSGVSKPVLVYKQPIDDVFKYKEKKDKEYFDILFLGSCIPRKGVDIFTKAIDKVFSKDTKVRVRMHMKPWSEALGDQRRKLFKEYSNNAQYILSSDTLPVSDIVELIQDSDLLVAPSRSEGLGLIPIQSVMCGTPAIVPNHSGFKEYNYRPGFLRINKNEITKGEGIYSEGTWFEPDFDELCDLLVHAKENKEKLFGEAKIGSELLREEYSVVSTCVALDTLINNIYVN